MNWSYKFAFDEMENVFENRPWLLVDDDFSSANSDEFLKMQKQFFLQRGWDWFKSALRGRIFPKLNLTTLTTWDRERNPNQGDPDAELVAKVQHQFPNQSIVSLIGVPHVVAGPPVDQNILTEVGKIANIQWKQKLVKVSVQKEADLKQIRDKWTAIAKRLIGGFAAGTAIGLAGLVGWAGANAWMLEQKAINSPFPPEKILADNIPETLQNPTLEPESADIQPEIAEKFPIATEMVDINPEPAKISQLDTRNLEGLDPMFSQKILRVLSALAKKGWKPRVAEGLRTIEQQQEKIDLGRSSLKNPQDSKHVQGLAVDIIDSRYGWQGPASDLDFQFWNDLGEAAREAGLIWGGDWKSFKDVAHVEVSNDKSSKGLLRIFHHAFQKMENGVHLPRKSAENTWSHEYAACEAG